MLIGQDSCKRGKCWKTSKRIKEKIQLWKPIVYVISEIELKATY